MPQLINVDPSDLKVFDSIRRVLLINSTTKSPVIDEELTAPRRRLILPAAGVSHIFTGSYGKDKVYVLQDRLQGLLTSKDTLVRIDHQTDDAVLIIIEEDDDD